MKTSTASLLALLLGAMLASAPARADSLACPDLSAATQVAACPTDEELRYTFMGFCGDNARLYGRDILTCASFENYREVKNTALWESADGRFGGYLSCNVEPETIRASKAKRMHVERSGKVTRLMCDYDNDHRLVHRTKAACKVEVEDCASGECRAACE